MRSILALVMLLLACTPAFSGGANVKAATFAVS